MSRSQGPHSTVDIDDQPKEMAVGPDGYLGQLRPTPNYTSQQPRIKSTYDDSSWPLFAMYSKMAEEADNKMSERWQKDADGILIFTGLFSAAVATLVSVSIQDLKPNSQDTSAFYLGSILQVLAKPNVSSASISSEVVKPPVFSPPIDAICVNVLWFLSLTIGLSCAVTATLLQQWARRYTRITQPLQCNPERRARIRALYAGSTDKQFIKVVGTMLPCFLHLALFLFFVGLAIFLARINHVVFGSVVYSMGWSVLLYAFITVISLFQLSGLLYTPLSSLPGCFIALLTCVFRTIIGDRFVFQASMHSSDIVERDFEWPYGELCRADEKILSRLSSKVDAHIFEDTIDALGDDSALENFFDAIPGFFASKRDNVLLKNLPGRIRDKFQRSLNGFLDRTFSSNTVSESARYTRVLVCLNAARAAHGSFAVSQLLQEILKGRWPESLQSIKMGESLRRWSFCHDQEIALHARSIVARILANVRDATAIALAVDQLGVSEHVLQDHLAHGDSVLLAHLIHTTRQIFSSSSDCFELLNLLSRFDIQDTIPGLRRDFCALWNQMVTEANDNGHRTAVPILKRLRHVYIALHQGTDAFPTAFSATTDDQDHILDRPSSYPSCRCLDFTLHRRDDESRETVQAPPTSSHTSPRPHPVTASVTPSRSAVPELPDHTIDRSLSGDVSDALQCISSATLLHPLESNKQLNLDTQLATLNISESSRTTNPVPLPILRSATTIPENEGVTVLPPATSPSLPSLTTGPVRDGVTAAELSSSVDFALTQVDHISHPLRTVSSSPTTAHSQNALRVTSVLGAHVTTSISTLSTHDGTNGPNRPIPLEVLPHPSQSAQATPDSVVTTSRPEEEGRPPGLSES